MIQGEVGVPIGSLRVISTEHALLNNNALSLKVNGLEEVTKLELDGSQLGNG